MAARRSQRETPRPFAGRCGERPRGRSGRGRPGPLGGACDRGSGRVRGRRPASAIAGHDYRFQAADGGAPRRAAAGDSGPRGCRRRPRQCRRDRQHEHPSSHVAGHAPRRRPSRPSCPTSCWWTATARPACPAPVQAVVGGDRRSLSIAAASILAKVARDRLMARLAERPSRLRLGAERRLRHGGAPRGARAARALPAPPALLPPHPRPSGGRPVSPATSPAISDDDLIVQPPGILRWRGRRFACAIGWGGVRSNKREGDGATPAGRFPHAPGPLQARPRGPAPHGAPHRAAEPPGRLVRRSRPSALQPAASPAP